MTEDNNKKSEENNEKTSGSAFLGQFSKLLLPIASEASHLAKKAVEKVLVKNGWVSREEFEDRSKVVFETRAKLSELEEELKNLKKSQNPTSQKSS